MAGNRNSGRKPAPPSDADSFSELLLDLQGQMIEMDTADVRHARDQRHRRRAACQTITRLAATWRDLRGLYPPEPTPSNAIPFPTRRDPEPTTPIHAVAA